MSLEKLSAAIQLIKLGNKQAALPLLKEVLQANPNDENAWLWMYACVEQAEQKKYCLQKVLEINPANQDARKALEKLTDPQPESVKQAAAQKPPPRPAPRRKGNRRPWIFILGIVLLLILCAIPSFYLAQTGQVSSFAAGLPFFPSATLSPTPTLTPTASASPSPSPTATSTPTRTLTPTPTITPTPSEVVEITWLTGFAQGANTDQGIDRKELAIMQSVVDDFNASQGFIHLNLEVTTYVSGADNFRAAIVAGHGPDILGPMVITQANDLQQQWLDLSIFPIDPQSDNPQLIKALHTKAGQFGLPFAVSPSALFYNTKLFDEAGLKYPPVRYGEKYQMPDGSQLEWNWDTLAIISRLLTLDNRGRNATEDGFDKENVAQYGYSWTYVEHPNNIGSYWGDGSMLADDGITAHIPEAWHAAWQWTLDGVWGTQPFIPSKRVESSALFKTGNSFNSGRIAMTIRPGSPLAWPSIKTWDLAAIPSYNGEPGGQVYIESFHIWKGSKHPYEAYLALSYLLNQGIPKLINVSPPYVSLSVRKDQHQVWVDAQKKRFPWVTNWDVLIAGLDYPEQPNVLSYVPNWRLAWTRGTYFYNILFGQAAPLPRDPLLGGPDGDMTTDDEIDDHDLAAQEQAYLDYLNTIFAGGR